MPTAANLEDVDISKYKIIRSGMFVFSGMQTGRDKCIRIALYQNQQPSLVSPAYTVFKIVADANVMPEYFYLYFNREESDRYGAFLSDSSVRANLDWDRFVDILIPLPSLAEQQKVVNAWKALREIKEQNEAIAAPLMQVCQSYIQDLKHKYESVEIGQFIEESDLRNPDNTFSKESVRGLATSKGLIDTKANLDGVSLTSYKKVQPNEIAFVPDTSRRGDKMSMGMNTDNESYLVSSISCVFRSKDENMLFPQFLYLWLCRSEFDRYARFHSWGSAREAFSFEDMKRVRIPLPPLEVQQSIVNLYNCANEAKKIAVEADRMSREVCPALIQYVVNN